MKLKKTIILSGIIASLVICTFKSLKIGPCSQEMETLINNKDD